MWTHFYINTALSLDLVMSSEAYRLVNFEVLLKTYHGDIRVGRIMEEMKFSAELTE